MINSPTDLQSIVKDATKKLILKSSTSVPSDILQELYRIRQEEKNSEINLSQIDLMVENIEYGCENKVPICQDTGLVNFFLKVGDQFPLKTQLNEIFLECLEELTHQSKIRPNTVDPITQKNQGQNKGKGMPPVYQELIKDSSDLIITVLNKGGGSENISKLFMLSASTGLEDMVPTILEHMKNAGGKPCPPVILGIGLGGDAVKAMMLGKKALLRPLKSRNPRKEVAELEDEILQKMNESDIGIMGLGGKNSCMDVRIEWAMRHPASYPVGLVVQCYSHRARTIKITDEGHVQIGKLNENFKFEQEGGIECEK